MFTASENKTVTLVLDSAGAPVNPQPWNDMSAAARFRPRDFQLPVAVSLIVASGSIQYKIQSQDTPVNLNTSQSVDLTGQQYQTLVWRAVSSGVLQILYQANSPFIDVSATPPADPLPRPGYVVGPASLVTGKASIEYVDQQVAALQSQITSGADRAYTHNQVSPSSTWTITHNLGKYPSVTVVNSAGDRVFGSERHDSVNQLTLTFETGGFSGKAYCN